MPTPKHYNIDHDDDRDLKLANVLLASPRCVAAAAAAEAGGGAGTAAGTAAGASPDDSAAVSSENNLMTDSADASVWSVSQVCVRGCVLCVSVCVGSSRLEGLQGLAACRAIIPCSLLLLPCQLFACPMCGVACCWRLLPCLALLLRGV